MSGGSMQFDVEVDRDSTESGEVPPDKMLDWKDICFLPFKMLWKTAIVLTVFFDVVFVSYMLTFDPTKNPSYSLTIYYLFEVFYAIDTGLLAMHKFLLSQQRKKTHVPKHYFHLVVDIITLIPYYETYYLLGRASKGKSYDFIPDRFKWKVILRIYRIPIFFQSIAKTPGLNHIASASIAHMVYFLLYSALGGCFWYFLMFSYPEKNWSLSYLQYHTFNNHSSISWYVISSSLVGNVFAHTWSGLIYSTRDEEYFFLMLTMILGFLNHYMFLFGKLTALYMKKINAQFRFSAKLAVIENMMYDWKIPQKTQKEVIEVYNAVWEQRSGIIERPKMIELLPESLRKEINLDIFWTSLKHSPIFDDLSMNTKRRLSLYMKSNFLMPGDFILKIGEIKSKMIYVVSGIVQILNQDESSPIMSFSSGTILGETSIFQPTISNVSINCASYCEIHSLDYYNFWKIIKRYPRASQPLREQFKERLSTAKTLQFPPLLKLKLRDKKYTDIRWIKTQWKYISHHTKSTSRKRLDENDTISPYHTSKYLNLYVLSEDVELKVKTICLRSTFPCIFEPTSSFLKTFESLVLTAVIIQSLLLPYMLYFEKKTSFETLVFFYTLDGFYVLGLILDVTTAIKKSDRIISTLGQILVYKGKQFTFLIDIIATIPWEILGASSSDPRFSLLRITRLLKTYKVFVIINKAELNVWVSYIQIRTIKYLVIILYAVYFLATFSYVIITLPKINPNGWLFYNESLRKLLKNRVSELSHFWLSFEYVLTMILSQAWRYYFAYSIPDIIIEFLVVMTGYFLYIFCFSEVGACAVLGHQAVADYQSYLTGLTNFTNRKHVPNDLKHLMYAMVQCQWEYNGRFEISGWKSIVRQLPDNLKNEVLILRIVRVLRLIPMFIECDELVLWKIASKATINIFPPNCVLVQEECFSSELNVILRGHCLSESYIPTDKYHQAKSQLSSGDCFPLLEMLMSIDSFLKVTAQSYVEIATITYRDLMDALDRESDLYKDVQKIVKEHFEENKIILSRQKGRLPEMISPGKFQGKGDFFQYEINDEIVKIKEKTYNLNVWKQLGTWQFLRHVCLKRTINPKKKLYVSWECFRCLISLCHMAYSFFFIHNAILPVWNVYVGHSFIIIALIDFYIRAHCQYYNKDGILVTHPLYTAKHYFTTSFLLDLYGVLPYRQLELENFFGRYKKHGLLILVIATRPFLIYRPFSGITYLQNQSTGKAVLYHNFKYVMVVILAIGLATTILQGVSCPGYSDDGRTACPEDSWLYKDVFKGKQSWTMTSIICYYVVISVFTTSTVGLFTFDKKSHVFCMTFLSFLLLAIRWFMLAKITSSRIGGNTRLVHYQHNMKEFLKFSKKYYLDQSFVEETVSYYEYIWKRTKGTSINRILSTFNPVLRENFCAFFYEPTMKLNEILNNLELSAVKHITPHFAEWHFKKDAEIIRCNDVTDTIYIVHKGSVEITIANDRLALLTQGGMFGNFNPKGKTRLTITATAKIHVEVLVLDVKTFYKVLSRYKTALNRLSKNRLINSEFILPLSESKTDHKHIESDLFDKNDFDKKLFNERKPLWKKLFLFTLTPDNKWLFWYYYFLNVHISTISSLIIMTFVVKVGDYDINKYYHVGHVFDLMFLIKIVLELHTSFVDQESGLIITKYSKILKKYVSSTTFWYELFTTFPFELIYYLFKVERVYRYFWTNRIFRIIFLIKYYNNCKNTLTVSRHLRWTFLMYSMMFLVYTNVCIWWKVACYEEVCKYYPKVTHEPIKLIQTNDTMQAFRLSFMYVINVFTSTGLRMVVPTNIYELIASIVMIGFSQLVTVVITAGCASILVLDKFEMTMFENGSRKVSTYLERMNLSIFLKRKVWKYYVEQWTKAHGQWLPVLIESSPSYLKEDVMQSLYAKHLLNHQVFAKTHKDFIRQLTVHLSFAVYLPGMNIVEKGDVDDSLYFVEEGVIVVYDVYNKLEVENMVLTTGATFGEGPGLFGIAHLHTYRALFTTKVLVLKRGTWEYLMDWFPASKERILDVSNRKYKPKTF